MPSEHKPHSTRNPEVSSAIREVAAVFPVAAATIARELDRLRGLEEQLETLQKERDALFNRRRVLIAENRDLKRRLWGLQDAVREASSPASEPESAPWVRTPSTKREDVLEGNDRGQGAA